MSFSRATRLAVASSASVAALALAGAPALANGRFPAANQLVVSPADPNTLVARTTFGILISRDHGQNWDWLCEQAVGFLGNADPALGLTQGGSAVLGKFDALLVSSGDWCNWSTIGGGLADAYVSDVVVRPDTPHAVLAVTSTYLGADAGAPDAGPMYASQVFQSTDDGAKWAMPGPPLQAGWVTETIEVAASDPSRLYVSAVRGALDAREVSLFVSTDSGSTWTPRPIPVIANVEPSAFVAAVDPHNADRVYVRTGGAPAEATASRLLVSDDAGKTYKTALTLPSQMYGFALSPDGSKVFAGSAREGLYQAAASDLAFTKRSAIHVRCLRATASELWACSDEVSGFTLGSSGDDGATFAARLHLDGVRGPVRCKERDAGAAICAQYWPVQCETLGGCGPVDAGPVDAGKVTPPTTTPAPSASCGCVLGPRSAAGWGAGAATILAFAALLRRRAKR